MRTKLSLSLFRQHQNSILVQPEAACRFLFRSDRGLASGSLHPVKKSQRLDFGQRLLDIQTFIIKPTMTGRALSANAIRIARGRAATSSLPTALPLARNYATTPAQQQQQQQPPSAQRNTVSSQAQPDPSLAPLRVLHPPSHLASYFWPSPLRRHYLTLQSLFLELAHVPSTVSSEILGRIRYGWWRDAIAACYRGEGRRYKHPIIVALEELIWDPEVRRRGGVVQEHFEAIVDAWVSVCAGVGRHEDDHG